MKSITKSDSYAAIPESLSASIDWEAIRRNRSASKADETKRALTKNWNTFTNWCLEYGAEPLPANPDLVEAYLVYLADSHPTYDRTTNRVRKGMRPSTVTQALWAINLMHRMASLPVPGATPQIRTAIAGIRRRKTVKTKQQAPLTIEDIGSIRFSEDLKGKRNKIVLLLGFAGCFRRSELVNIHLDQVEKTSYGLRVFLPRSKTDQIGEGTWVDILRAEKLTSCCPVAAYTDWLAASGITDGLVLRGFTRNTQTPLRNSLSTVSVDAIVKWAASQCGFDPSKYGAHSLRAGKATYLFDLGKSPALVAKHGRWKSLDMVLTYYRGEVARGLVGSY